MIGELIIFVECTIDIYDLEERLLKEKEDRGAIGSPSYFPATTAPGDSWPVSDLLPISAAKRRATISKVSMGCGLNPERLRTELCSI